MLEVESDVLLVCHVGGAQALRQGDASATLAGFMGVESPCYPDVMGLFAGPHPAGVERSMDTPGGGLRSLSIPIGTRDSLQVYHLAGHSPDSLCFRVGGVLFTGDVTELDEPGLDKDSARDSLRKLLWLLDHINIAEVYPGHGPMMPLPQARRAFEDALSRLA